MISTVFQIAVLRMWNNKQELLLALVVPILFFSIFALIFGRGVGTDAVAIDVAIVDDDSSSLSAEIVDQLAQQDTINVKLKTLHTDANWSVDRLAKSAIRDHSIDMVIHLPKGFENSVRQPVGVSVGLLCEGSNPVGQQIVGTVVTQIVTAASGTIPLRSQFASLTTPTAVAGNTPVRLPRADVPLLATPVRTVAPNSINFVATDVFATDKHDPEIAMYAAGIAVMFLLFSATGAGGSLLEEHEAGTLDRLLASRLSVGQLLAGKWMYITCLGLVQLIVMFTWAQIVFGVDLLGHLPGFLVMAVCTAAATSSLALCLAVFCRSRAQLNGVSVVLILSMSALGGSMVPRYIMSEQMQRWGQLTFNAWALDGFKKVFWYELPVQALGLEVKMLLGAAIGLAAVAYVFADRWSAD